MKTATGSLAIFKVSSCSRTTALIVSNGMQLPRPKTSSVKSDVMRQATDNRKLLVRNARRVASARSRFGHFGGFGHLRPLLQRA